MENHPFYPSSKYFLILTSKINPYFTRFLSFPIPLLQSPTINPFQINIPYQNQSFILTPTRCSPSEDGFCLGIEDERHQWHLGGDLHGPIIVVLLERIDALLSFGGHFPGWLLGIQ